MLVLSRKADEQIQIGPNITITILKIKGLAVRIGIEAPDDVKVMRTEVVERTAMAEDELSSPRVEDLKRKSRSGSRRNHSGEGLQSPMTEPSAESPRRRVPRLRLAPPVLHPLRSGPAPAADGFMEMTAGSNVVG
jgi:carbon storage regulator